jgi:RNA polymerase sigma-70 factor (ECF subfamily)
MSFPAPDPDLLKAAARGKVEAWDAIVVAWLPVVAGWCRRLGGPRLDAEDLTHDVFVQVFDDLRSLREPMTFPAWLYRITRGRIAKAREKAQRRERLLHFVPFAASHSGRQRDVTASEKVLELLQQLPEDQREVLVLCVVEEHTRDEVAELLGVPLGTVKSRLRLATDRIRTLAQQEGLLEELEEVARWTP